jgi:uncharacterized protein (TIGR03067 family)
VDTGKLQGAWQLVYQESNGKKLPDEKFARMSHAGMIFTGDRIRCSAELDGFDFQFTLRSDLQPKGIDLMVTDTADEQYLGKKFFGIYRLESNTLKICYNKTDRPTEFSAVEDSRNTLILLRRTSGSR